MPSAEPDFVLDPVTFRRSLKLPEGFGPMLHTAYGQPYIDFDKLAPGLANCYRLAACYYQGSGLDVGAAYFRANAHNGFPGATPVDISIPGSGDAEKLNQCGDTQDYVIASHILEHLDNPEKAIAEAFRVLREGGFYFTYNPYPGHAEWDPSLSKKNQLVHKWQPEPSSLCRMLIMAGFTIEYAEWAPDHIHSFIVVGRA